MGGTSADGTTRRGALARVLLFLGLATVLTGAMAAVLPSGIVWGGVALLVGSSAAGVGLLRWDGRPWTALGLPLDRAAPVELGLGWVLGLGAAAGALALVAAAGGVRWTADGGSGSAWVAGGVFWLAALAIPALAEEVALRGYLLPVAARGFGPLPALVATSVLFGLLHAGNPEVGIAGLAGTTAAGLFLGALVLRTRSLWGATGAHLAWNWALLWPADLPVSGLDLADAPWVDGVNRGPRWLGGGAFGPEASPLAALVLTGLAVWVWRSERFRPVPARTTTTNESREGEA